jgi:hypothetical protein
MPHDLKLVPTEELEKGLDRAWQTETERRRIEHELYERYAAPARNAEQWMLAGTIIAVIVGVLGVIAVLAH